MSDPLLTAEEQAALDELGETPERADGRGAGGSGVRLVAADSLTMTRPVWVWRDRAAAGGVTLLAGREGDGKTIATIDVAAALTLGLLAGDREGTPGHVVYVGIEDDWQSVMLPRLVAAKADLSRVHFVACDGGGVFAVDRDLPALAAAVAALEDVALVVIDPLDAHLGDDVDSHRKSEVQRAVTRLAELAQSRRCAVLGIAHLNKNEMSRDVLSRVIGSKGFTTGPRSVLAVGVHPDDESQRVLILAKTNLTTPSRVPALVFEIKGVEVPHDDGGTIRTARVLWVREEAGLDAGCILATTTAEDRGALDEATDWLRDLLGDGEPVPYREVERLAQAAGISRATLQRARSRVGAVVERDDSARGRPSAWRLPAGAGVSSRRVSSQSQRLSLETKSEPCDSGRLRPLDGVSSQGCETETKGTAERRRKVVL